MDTFDNRIALAARWMTRAAALALLATATATVTLARADAVMSGVIASPSGGTTNLPFVIAGLVLLGIVVLGGLYWRQRHPVQASSKASRPAAAEPASRTLQAPVRKAAPTIASAAPARSIAKLPKVPARPNQPPVQGLVARAPAPAPAMAPATEIETIEYTPFANMAAKRTVEPPVADKLLVSLASPPAAEVVRNRIIDRYIGARFPGIATKAADLADVPRTIKCARLLFEDGRPARAHELLKLATQHAGEQQDLWLAALELAFLDRDTVAFKSVASRFESTHPASPAWPTIRKMGENLGQSAPSADPAGDFPDYSGWMELPNWLQAPRDLTPEIASSELHSRLKARAQAARHVLADIEEAA